MFVFSSSAYWNVLLQRVCSIAPHESSVLRVARIVYHVAWNAFLHQMLHVTGYMLCEAAHLGEMRGSAGLPQRVSPFGNSRIVGCYTPPRDVSPLRCVLHRLLMSRHPPFALIANHPNADLHQRAALDHYDF